MLREEVEEYSKLTGEDGWCVPVIKIGAYLDGYNKGLEELKQLKKIKEHNKIIHLLKHAALHNIDTGRLDGKCEDAIPLKDAIAIVDLVYKAESEEEGGHRY